MRFKSLLALLFIGLVVIAGCGDDGETIESAGLEGSYTIAILPQYSDEVLTEKYQAMTDYLSAKTGAEFTLVFADSFEDHAAKVNSGEFDFALQNPVVYSKVAGSTELVAQELKTPHYGGPRDKFRGVIFTRRVDGVPLMPTLPDIAGKRVSVVSYISAGGYISQMMTLDDRGIDISTVTFFEAVGNEQENVLRDVYEGRADVGFVRATTWGMLDNELENPDDLMIIAETEWLPNWAFTAKAGIDPELIKVVKAALFELNAESQEMIDAKMIGFQEPDFDAYNKLVEYLNK
jgi:ABC-type phosphate/phosphonate transport system substrate-binding protein